MKRTRTTTIVACAAASLALTGLLAGCSVGPVNLDDFFGTPSVAEAREARRSTLSPVVTSDALRQADTLTVGIPTSETAPLVLTSSSGERAGIDIDLAYALADELGLGSVVFVTVDDVSTALSESCDVVMGVESSSAEGATVAGSYVQSATVLFTKGDVTAPIDASALAGATVGVQGGSVSEGVLNDYETGATASTFSNLNEAFDALEEGTVDYVLCDAYAGAYLATAYPGTVFAGTLDEPVPVGVAVGEGELQSAVQGALDAIQTGGVGDIVRSRWVGSLPSLSSETRVTGLVEASADQAAADGAQDASAE
ncbi:MAG TPA: transporter substrate-binding domain-containing protein [Candidatus Olsenella pullistercoris]|uniref:Transporter substrate-binding domain-containing protein n=1 Tax=Candidatus Olsenella pullistercoris TaxID=2838712 RepID=A0A9D2EZP2_9ACTN|nr:transporter substrate-binding domain-containing protein [Candidatus Olsenella pullistercoris]